MADYRIEDGHPKEIRNDDPELYPNHSDDTAPIAKDGTNQDF